MSRFLLTTVLLLGGLALWPTAAAAGPGTVAVLYFENQGNEELEPLKVGLAQMMVTDIKGTPGVTVVERQQLQAILDELELGHSGMADPKAAAKVGKLLGAEWMVLGSYFELMGTLRIDARLVQVETGEILFAHGVDDKTKAFMEMEGQLAEAFRGALQAQAAGGSSDAPSAPVDPAGVPETGEGPTGFADAGSGGDGGDAAADGGPTVRSSDGGTDDGAADAGTPAVVAEDADVIGAAVQYSEGLIYLDQKDLPRAREAFQAALTSNPQLEAAKAELAALDI